MTLAYGTRRETLQAFDQLAGTYDELFTHSLIGRAQRDAVWDTLKNTLRAGTRVLEINCGTGEDALFLARHQIAVVACDGAGAMIATARKRLEVEGPEAEIVFQELATEHLWQLRPAKPFNGALSNFSGLNCVADLEQVARELARLLEAKAPLVICLSTRFCLAEIAWYCLHGRFRKAFRRASGSTIAHLGPYAVEVYYPTLRRITRIFSPWFCLRSCKGIGVAVPPSYLEAVIRRWPALCRHLREVDRRIAHLPGVRILGDHMLLHFERLEDACC
jgi:ubiquinone/menaquinone biosynthesis C-methylase UbiE